MHISVPGLVLAAVPCEQEVESCVGISRQNLAAGCNRFPCIGFSGCFSQARPETGQSKLLTCCCCEKPHLWTCWFCRTVGVVILQRLSFDCGNLIPRAHGKL